MGVSGNRYSMTFIVGFEAVADSPDVPVLALAAAGQGSFVKYLVWQQLVANAGVHRALDN